MSLQTQFFAIYLCYNKNGSHSSAKNISRSKRLKKFFQLNVGETIFQPSCILLLMFQYASDSFVDTSICLQCTQGKYINVILTQYYIKNIILREIEKFEIHLSIFLSYKQKYTVVYHIYKEYLFIVSHTKCRNFPESYKQQEDKLLSSTVRTGYKSDDVLEMSDEDQQQVEHEKEKFVKIP